MKRVELMKNLEGFFNKFKDLIITDFNNEILVIIDDFDGFDENWNEIDREVQINVDNFIKFLQDNSISYEMDFYSTFNFEDCCIKLGYSSYDI